MADTQSNQNVSKLYAELSEIRDLTRLLTQLAYGFAMTGNAPMSEALINVVKGLDTSIQSMQATLLEM